MQSRFMRRKMHRNNSDKEHGARHVYHYSLTEHAQAVRRNPEPIWMMFKT